MANDAPSGITALLPPLSVSCFRTAPKTFVESFLTRAAPLLATETSDHAVAHTLHAIIIATAREDMKGSPALVLVGAAASDVALRTGDAQWLAIANTHRRTVEEPLLTHPLAAELAREETAPAALAWISSKLSSGIQPFERCALCEQLLGTILDAVNRRPQDTERLSIVARIFVEWTYVSKDVLAKMATCVTDSVVALDIEGNASLDNATRRKLCELILAARRDVFVNGRASVRFLHGWARVVGFWRDDETALSRGQDHVTDKYSLDRPILQLQGLYRDNAQEVIAGGGLPMAVEMLPRVLETPNEHALIFILGDSTKYVGTRGLCALPGFVVSVVTVLMLPSNRGEARALLASVFDDQPYKAALFFATAPNVGYRG